MGSRDEHERQRDDVVPFQAGRAERQSLLEAWKTMSQPSGQLKRHRRYEFEDRLVPAEILHPGGGNARVEVMMVNISTGGCCLIHRGYLHPSTSCKLMLENNSGEQVQLRASVRWCQLLRGVYHTTGLEWSVPVQPRDFVDPRIWLELSQDETPRKKETLKGKFQFLTSDKVQDMLLRMLLRESDVTLETSDSSGNLLDAVRSGGYDVVIVDTDTPEIDAPSIPARLRSEGYTGPVVAVTHESGPSALESLRKAGYCETLLKPLREEALVMGIHMAVDNFANAASGTGPIFSSIASTDGAREWIVKYVELVRDRAKKLEEAARADDTEIARRICDTIRDSGTSYGFPLLTEVAHSALTAVNASGSAQEALSSIRQLIRVIERLSLPPEVEDERKESADQPGRSGEAGHA